MKRVISLILSIAMVASLATGLAVTSFAEEPGPGVCVFGYEFAVGGFKYKVNSIYYTVMVVRSDTNHTGEIIIPITVTDIFNNDYTVKDIDQATFRGDTGLTSIVLPSSLKKIGLNAFYDCKSLTNVYISAMTPPTLGIDAFYHCSNSLKIYVPAECVETYQSDWLAYADKITAMEPSPEELFAYTTNSDSATITGFKQGVDVPANLVIPDTLGEYPVTSIGELAFQECTGLTSVIIGNNVTSIGESAFSFCSGLTSITIPASVESIGKYAFLGCSHLESVIVKAATPPTLGDDVFADCSNLTIYVPANSVDTYKGTAGWSEYAEKIQAIVGPITINGVDIEDCIGSYSGEVIATDANSVTVDKISNTDKKDDVEIYIPSGKTLVVSSTDEYVICVKNSSLNITGGGTLIAYTNANGMTLGIHADKDITINGCAVEATGPYAIQAGKEGSLTIKGSSIVTATSNGIAIYANNIMIEEDSIVTAESSLQDGQNLGAAIMGLSVITITNSTVTANAYGAGIMTEEGSIYISSDKPVKARGGEYAIVAIGQIFVGNELITQANIENGTLDTTTISGCMLITATDADDGYVTIHKAQPAGPVEFILNGTEVKVSGTDTFKYQTDTNTAEQTSDGNTLTLEKGNYYIIKAGSETFYINYVTKDITLNYNYNNLDTAITNANNLLDAINKTDTDIPDILTTNIPDGKVYVTQAAASEFTNAISSATDILNRGESEEGEKPTQFELDDALMNLNKAQIKFIKSCKANTLYLINTDEVTFTDLENKSFGISYSEGTEVEGADHSKWETKLTINEFTTSYFSYVNSTDKSAFEEAAKKPSGTGGGAGGTGDGKYTGSPIELTTSSDNEFINITAVGYTFEAVYYKLGDNDYFNVYNNKAPVLGDGEHTVRVLATYKGQTSMYEEKITITGYNKPVAVMNNNVVFINTNETNPSKIYYTETDDKTVYIPITDGGIIKLDAAKFDGVSTITFDTTPVEIKKYSGQEN